jgi:hypothetical protein
VIYNLDAATFTVLGNFITSCYTKNWLWQDLLQKPLFYKGSLQKEKFLVFQLPIWLPFNDCILIYKSAGIESKLKDLFIPMQVQKQDEANQFLILNFERFTSLLSPNNNAELVYWPGYRFVIEPMTYRKENTPSLYMLKAFDYILRVTGQEVELDEARQSLRTSSLSLRVSGNSEIDSIELTESEGRSFWSLAEKVIRLEGTKFEMFCSAFSGMSLAGAALQNCSVQTSPQTVELRYVG